jgi:hypothetical protein
VTVRRRLSFRRSTTVALARAGNAVFFLLTSTYCLLTYSSFAYQQFIKPHLVNWLTGFVVWHHLGFWLVLLVTAWTLLPELGAAPGRLIAWSYLAVSALCGLVLLVRPVLPQVENNSRGLVLALVALVPPVWLALFDHRATSASFTPTPSSGSRVVKAALLAGAVVWAEQMVMIPSRLSQTGEIPMSPVGVEFGAATSLGGHLLVAALWAGVVFAIVRLARRWQAAGRAEYWLLAALAGVTVTLVFDRVIFAAIAFRGRVPWLLSAALGLMIAFVWSSLSRLVHSGRDASEASALDVWLAAVPGVRSRAASAAGLAALVAAELAALTYVVTFDWDFLIQKLCMLAIWLLAFAYGLGVMRTGGRTPGWNLRVAVAVVPFLVGGVEASRSRSSALMGEAAFVPEFALEGYVAVDPSYRLIHTLLRVDSSEDAEFYAYLRAHSLIQHVDVAPVDVDFERPLHPAAGWKPNIFLFVVDSLRRDYVSPYNPAVAFTPAIGRFAADSLVFTRAFTRYGGTGLAVPAIWTGGMLLHKQYVTPFDPMNTLFKLLVADGYRRLMSMDSIVVQLMPPPPAGDEVDLGVPVVNYRFCQTLEDLQAKLKAGIGDSRPIFGYSLPQDIHISHVRDEPVPPGASYPGFVAPVAAQIERFDRCFGEFIDFLQRTKRYDDSVIVLMSDHGDSLGEGLRWGHSYTMFPEVARIPLIVHLPPKVLEKLTVDPSAVSLSTDLTPTFYVLAGHTPADLGPLYGRPLLMPRGADTSARRRNPVVVASSYGGVYAVLRDNGTRLYIADGVNNHDYAYDMTGDRTRRVGITAADRSANRTLIRRQIDEIASTYHFTPGAPEVTHGTAPTGPSRPAR